MPVRKSVGSNPTGVRVFASLLARVAKFKFHEALSA